jgi:hypothetical protein
VPSDLLLRINERYVGPRFDGPANLRGVVLASILAFVSLAYAGIGVSLQTVISTVVPTDAATIITVAILLAATGAVIWRCFGVSSWLATARVAHLSNRLPSSSKVTSSSVHPVRLSGVGSRRDRHSVDLIHRDPDANVGGVRARNLHGIEGRKLYWVISEQVSDVWVVDAWKFRREISFDRSQLSDIAFIDQEGSRYCGEFRLTFSGNMHVYLSSRARLRAHS